MKDQYRVTNLLERTNPWPRGRSVQIRDGLLSCELATNRTYDLVEAYKYRPHESFLKLKSDDELSSFVRAWGPLRWPYRKAEGISGTVALPVEEYWLFQGWLKALVKLLGAFKRSRKERECLREFLGAEEAWHATSPVFKPGDASGLHLALKGLLAKPGLVKEKDFRKWIEKGDLVSWLEKAERRSVRVAFSFALESGLSVPGPELRATWRAGSPQIVPRWKVSNLEGALKWMIWNDEWTQHPLLFCEECGQPFQPRTRHRKIYCNTACAHRVAAREWRKRNLGRKERRRKRP